MKGEWVPPVSTTIIKVKFSAQRYHDAAGEIASPAASALFLTPGATATTEP